MLEILFKRESFTLSRDCINEILEFFIEDTPYDSDGFDECLAYFKQTWNYCKFHDKKYKLFIQLSCENRNELPLEGYMKILWTLLEINDILKTNCHCICIFTAQKNQWSNTYELITKLWNPVDLRPILFTDSKEEMDLFLKSNKLVAENNTN